MHKLIVQYPQPEDPQAFLAYYETHHVPLAAQLPGLVTQSYGRPSALGGDNACFLMWQGTFADRASLLAALRSNIGAKVSADIPNYSPTGAVMMEYEEIAPQGQ